MTYANYRDVKANKPVRWWHEAIIEDLLLYPLDTLEARSKRLNYSTSYLSVIINTDLFKAAYQQRKQTYNSQMDQAIVMRTTQVAAKGLDLLLEAMETKRAQIPFGVLADTVDKTLNRLGYGVKPVGTPVNVSVGVQNTTTSVTVTAEQLAEARQALRAAEAHNALAPPAPSPERNPELLDLSALPEAGES